MYSSCVGLRTISIHRIILMLHDPIDSVTHTPSHSSSQTVSIKKMSLRKTWMHMAFGITVKVGVPEHLQVEPLFKVHSFNSPSLVLSSSIVLLSLHIIHILTLSPLSTWSISTVLSLPLLQSLLPLLSLCKNEFHNPLLILRRNRWLLAYVCYILRY